MEQENLEAIMALIINAGNAKSFAMEAIQAAKQGDFQSADQCIVNANKEITQAHNGQTKLLTLEASGEKLELSLLVVHSQDHLMTAMTFIDLAKEIIDVYRTR